MIETNTMSVFGVRIGAYTVPHVDAVEQLACEIERHSFRYTTEGDLQSSIDLVLRGVTDVEREVAREGDRFDFLCSGIVIETKVQGSQAAALQQCSRYLRRPDVHGLILVGPARWTAGLGRGRRLHEKPFRLVRVGRESF
jgi:hypothetical protein